MTTITFKEDLKIKTNFIGIKDLYDYIIDNQLLTEVWELSEDELSKKSKQLLKQSIKKSNLINI